MIFYDKNEFKTRMNNHITESRNWVSTCRFTILVFNCIKRSNRQLEEPFFYTPLQIKASHQSIAAKLWPLIAHIYHVMIIVTGGFSKKSFYYYFYFIKILLNNLELVFLELLNIQNSFLFYA